MGGQYNHSFTGPQRKASRVVRASFSSYTPLVREGGLAMLHSTLRIPEPSSHASGREGWLAPALEISETRLERG